MRARVPTDVPHDGRLHLSERYGATTACEADDLAHTTARADPGELGTIAGTAFGETE